MVVDAVLVSGFDSRLIGDFSRDSSPTDVVITIGAGIITVVDDGREDEGNGSGKGSGRGTWLGSGSLTVLLDFSLLEDLCLGDVMEEDTDFCLGE